jgi:transposase
MIGANLVPSCSSEILRSAGVEAAKNAIQFCLIRWRAAAGLAGKSAGKQASAFVPVMLPAPPAAAATPSPSGDRGLIEIELASGRRLRVSGPVDAATLKQVIAVLEGR